MSGIQCHDRKTNVMLSSARVNNVPSSSLFCHSVSIGAKGFDKNTYSVDKRNISQFAVLDETLRVVRQEYAICPW